jgi:MFS family permease
MSTQENKTEVRPPPITAAHYSWYVVAVLTVCYTLSFIDRQILSLLVGPIKADLHISDTQVGLLGGLAFSLFYTLMGLPLGRMVDRYNRRNLVAIGVFFWSAMTAACAFTRSFAGLFLARMGVGLGEATLNPAAVSMIADSFPKERLASALSTYSMGIYLGAGLALLVGGFVIQSVAHMPVLHLPLVGAVAPWRLTFLIVGLPGIMVALWAMTLREPGRLHALVAASGERATLDLRQTLSEITRRLGSVLGISVGQMIVAIGLYAFLLWSPAFLQRVHGWSAQQTGTRLGIVVLVGGCIGMYLGGRLADRWLMAGHRDAALRLCAFSAIGASVAFGLAFLMRDSPWWTLAFFLPGLAMMAMPAGVCYAALQMILPNQVRGQAVAFYLLVANLGGLTLGPLLPGLLNDYVFHSEGAVGESMLLTVVIATFIAGLIFAASRRYYRRDYAIMHPNTYA